MKNKQINFLRNHLTTPAIEMIGNKKIKVDKYTSRTEEIGE